MNNYRGPAVAGAVAGLAGVVAIAALGIAGGLALEAFWRRLERRLGGWRID